MAEFNLILVGDSLTLILDSNEETAFSIRHNSTGTATGVVANLTTPAGLTVASGNPSQGVFTAGTGNWAVGDIPTGVAATLDVTFTVTDTSVKPLNGWVIELDSVLYGLGDSALNNNAKRTIDGATCEDINQCSNKTTITSIGAGNYSVLTTDVTVVKTAHTGGGDTLTLPLTADSGQIFAIHDLADAGADNITIDTAGAELIDGVANY